MNATRHVGALTIAVVVSTGCFSSDDTDFWQVGATYGATLYVTDSIRVLPERRQFVGEPKDSTLISFRVDSIVAVCHALCSDSTSLAARLVALVLAN